MFTSVRLLVSRFSAVNLFFCLVINSCDTPATNNEPAKESTQDSTGSVAIFDGITLKGWKGDTAVWHVEDSAIVGQITASSSPLKSNTFLIWNNGTPADFELSGAYEISSEGNSGVQYRSEEVEGVPFGLRGYQLDIDGANTYTGQNYEERARSIIAFRGQEVTLPEVTDSLPLLVKNNIWSVSKITGSLGSGDSLKALIHDGWNTFHIVAKGNHLQHYINDVLMCDVTDDDTKYRKASGVIGLQMHAGHVMRVAYKDLKFKEIK